MNFVGSYYMSGDTMYNIIHGITANKITLENFKRVLPRYCNALEYNEACNFVKDYIPVKPDNLSVSDIKFRDYRPNL